MSNNIWDKQPQETEEEFETFKKWLWMEERDVHEAYRQATGQAYRDGNRVVAPIHILNAYRGVREEQIHWEERAKAWDAHQKNVELKWWMRQRRKIRQSEYDIAQLLLSKAKEMLDWPIYEDEIIEEDGVTIVRKPARWAFRDVQGMVKVSSEIMRLAAEMEQSTQKLVLSLSPEAMRAVELLEKHGVSYGQIVISYEKILLETASKYESENKLLIS